MVKSDPFWELEFTETAVPLDILREKLENTVLQANGSKMKLFVTMYKRNVPMLHQSSQNHDGQSRAKQIATVAGLHITE